MDHALLSTFRVFAETMNFTTAGRSLHLSQPAVHLQVKKLEAQLGQALYLRRGRTLELTDAGRSALRFAKRVQADADQFLAELREDGASRPLSLAAGEGAFLYLLGPAIRTHRGPLRIKTCDREASIEAVLSHDVDVGVIAAPDDARLVLARGLSARRLTQVGSMLVVPKDHRLAGRRKVSLKDLEGERLIVPPQGRPHRETLARHLTQEGVRHQIAVEATGWELSIHFAALGMGVTVVNACCRLVPEVVGIPLSGLPSIGYHAVHTLAARPAALAFVDHLAKHGDRWKARPGSQR